MGAADSFVGLGLADSPYVEKCNELDKVQQRLDEVMIYALPRVGTLVGESMLRLAGYTK